MATKSYRGRYEEELKALVRASGGRLIETIRSPNGTPLAVAEVTLDSNDEICVVDLLTGRKKSSLSAVRGGSPLMVGPNNTFDRFVDANGVPLRVRLEAMSNRFKAVSSVHVDKMEHLHTA